MSKYWNLGSVQWTLYPEGLAVGACLQYYVVQLIVALAWRVPYSWNGNTISDLGNTMCGKYGSRVVCSPLHGIMNVSFVALGVTYDWRSAPAVPGNVKGP